MCLALQVWINSLGLNVQHLANNLQDGVLILQVLDKVVPGKVNWTR
jgi:hypothetical protein